MPSRGAKKAVTATSSFKQLARRLRAQTSPVKETEPDPSSQIDWAYLKIRKAWSHLVTLICQRDRVVADLRDRVLHPEERAALEQRQASLRAAIIAADWQIHVAEMGLQKAQGLVLETESDENQNESDRT